MHNGFSLVRWYPLEMLAVRHHDYPASGFGALLQLT